MSNVRPTRQFKSSNGEYTAVLNEYITGEENRTIKAIYRNALRDPEGTQNVDVGFLADNRAIELAVISIEGPNLAGETIVEKVLSMPSTYFAELVSEITEVIEGKKKSES